MMDITKSREEFEKWLEEVHGLYGEDIDWQPERNCYRIFGIHLAWCAWQASRESIEKKAPPKIENHMSQPIAVLDISSRTKNAILNGGISTIGDLLRIGHLGVLKVPGIGRGCEAEIKSALANLSIEWKPWGEGE
ncbi:DNA-directed RNA polymerase subunit alpha C-terminal domain-containing protein [Yersinia intermedia]|uniref:DNA-directed RNA polymerase subunit alpha C-terminal domain-containing protein n=2 Tax=Yersinia TaxID=629 RepID=UPI001CFC7262|nr:DNA-directed RNA polymerase subunit alpha C-terminal domain-containing protein [Yersinia intermedia]MCB5329302.1 hypothetical protein [Yersinia intermedia]HEN3278058.1 hypothetical protein [Yersinia enterocolitica]